MKPPAPGPLARLADAINEGAAIDWEGEASNQPALRPTLDCLKLVEAIASGYRSLPAAPAPPAPAPSPRRTGATRRRSPMRGARALFEWGPLRVLESIGAGSFGEVYRAFDPALEREVALKLWRHGPEASMDRLLMEARRLARVRHPNVLVVHGADEYAGRAGMWTDLIVGRSLEQCLAGQGPWGPTETAAAGIELCRALAALHAANLVHRDVKTTNVMREHGGRIVLMDFGAAGELTRGGRGDPADGIVGTPLTLAPEQLEGSPATPAADLYALGVLLYRLLSGAYPVEARSLDELRENHRRGRRVPLRDRRADLPARIVQAVERALEPAAARYAGAGAMEKALADSLGFDAPRAPAARVRRAKAPDAGAPVGAVPHNLPETLTRFLGREQDLAACMRLTGPGGWLTLIGPAASGKTRLALRLAEIRLPEFPDGVRFVDLEGLEDSGRLADRLAAAVGRGARGLEDLAEGLRDLRLLLVLDPADVGRTSVAGFGELLRRICPGIGVIATCREALGVSGETTHALAETRPFAGPDPAESGAEAAALPFVGRADELALLGEAAECARRRSGRTLLVAGEAGLGKSRLMEEFRRRAEARGCLCLGGRCSYRSGRNFEPFVEALEEFARRFAPAGVAPGEGGRRATLPGTLFDGLHALLDSRHQLVPEPRNREQVWFLLDSLLKRIARHETLVLFLDDLHWADEGTTSLLNHVTRNSGGARLMVVGSYRPEEVAGGGPQSHPLQDVLRLLSTSPRFRAIPLRRLDEGDSGALARAMLAGAGLGAEHVAPVHERAQGNPFFTIEMVRLLADSSGAGTGGRDGPGTPLPRTITDVVLRRLSRLERDERDLLDLAAVEGERFHSGTLETVTRTSRLAVLKQLRALEQDHHLIVPIEDGHRFSHGLIREVLLREMPPELRREYHGVVAGHLMRDFGDRPDHAARIAEQLFEAGRFAEAVPRFVAAAREALRLFLYERGVQLLQRALDALDRGGSGDESRGGILRKKCEVLLLLGRPHLAREAAEAALAVERERGDEPARVATLEALGEAALAQGDLKAAESFLVAARSRHVQTNATGPLARCDRKLGAVASRRGDFAGALARLEGALDCLREAGDDPERARIRLDVGDVLYRRGDYDLALKAFEEAVESLRRLDERSDLARGLNLLGNAWFQRGATDRALERYREAMSLAIGLDDHQSIARIRANLGNIHLVRGETPQARGQYEAALASFESIGDRTGAGRTLMALGNVCFMRGRYEDAAGYYRDSAARREETGDRQGWANSLDNLGVTEYHLGRLGPAREHLETAIGLRTELGDRPGCVESAINLGALTAVLGDVVAAERLFTEAILAAGELGDARKRTRAILSRACLRLWAGDPGGCAAAVDEATALGVGDPSLRARALLLQGLAEPPDGSREGLLRRALEAAVASESPAEQATVRLALAGWELESGGTEAAASGIAEALRIVDAGRLPLLELHALRQNLMLLDRGGPGAGPDREESARRVRTLVGMLSAEPPGGRAPIRIADGPLFPLP